MISIQKARQLIGKEASNLSDKELLELILKLYALSEILLTKESMNQNGSK